MNFIWRDEMGRLDENTQVYKEPGATCVGMKKKCYRPDCLVVTNEDLHRICNLYDKPFELRDYLLHLAKTLKES